MSSLAYCIKIHGLHKIEGDRLKAAAKAIRIDEGYSAAESNTMSVRQAITDLETERKDILSQIKKQLPEHFKAPVKSTVPKTAEQESSVKSTVEEKQKPGKTTEKLPKDRVVAAAIKLKDGKVIVGETHVDAFKELTDEQQGKIIDTGFVTEKGKYLYEKEAKALYGKAEINAIVDLQFKKLEKQELAEPTGVAVPEQKEITDKETWEMTSKEILESIRKPGKKDITKPNLISIGKGILTEGMTISGIPASEIPGWEKAIEGHKRNVEQAIKEGKIDSHPDYPELTAPPVPEQKEIAKPEAKEETLNFTQFAKKYGYISDYDVTDHGTLSPSGQERIAKSERVSRDKALLERLESNKQGHIAYRKAIKDGAVFDPEGKITKESLGKEKIDSSVNGLRNEIKLSKQGIEYIENLGTMAYTKSGKLKKGYQLTVDDYQSRIDKAVEQLNEFENGKDEKQSSAQTAPKPKAKQEQGRAWVKGKQTAIMSATEIKRGKNKGKFHVILTKGRDSDGNIIPGRKKIVGAKDIIVMPEEVEAVTKAKETVEHLEEPETIKDKPAPPTKEIDDFGEKIGGARKDYYKLYVDKMKTAKEGDIAAIPLSKSWPEPDYAKLIKEDTDPWTVAFVRAARDEIPIKPRQGWKLNSWVSKVEILRDFANNLLSGEITKETIQSRLNQKEHLHLGDLVSGKIALYEAVGHEKSLKGITFKKTFFSLYDGEKNVTKWLVENSRKATAFSNLPLVLGKGDTKEAAIEDFKSKYKDAVKTKTARGVKFTLYTKRGEKGTYIGKKIGTNYVDIEKFSSTKEAREYLNAHQEELEDKLSRYKNIPVERREANRERIGDDHRDGKEVTPEMFQDSFGFRGVEFGNWVNSKERQENLNKAYDALMDLSLILDIPSKAISLNGELGLAFGARGIGGKRAPSAHYESDKIVINLTKKKGPGSLAHEWFHALDNYLSRGRGFKRGYLTESSSEIKNDPTRKEILRAFKGVVDTIEKTGMSKRALELDKRRSKPYWAKRIEMSARAFENYVIEKLSETGKVNDYLANIASAEEYSSEMVEGLMSGKLTALDMYPYLLESEVESVTVSFDKLFDVIEAETTDKGVKLFSTKPGKPQDVITRKDMREIFSKMKNIRTGTDKDDNFWFKPTGRSKVTIFEVDHVAGYMETSDGRLPVGSYLRNIIELKTKGTGYTADVETVFHEFTHFIHGAGILSGNDIKAIDRAIQREAETTGDITEEQRADYLGKKLAGRHAEKNLRIKRILRKIADFMNAIYEFVSRTRTARGIVADIESGAIIKEKKGVIEGVNEFAQEISFSLKRAAGKITDNPNFRKWFGDSKAIDTKSDPIIGYHGTNSDFFQFNRATDTPYSLGDGIYLTDNKDVASRYGDRVVEVFMSIQDPMYFDAKGKSFNAIADDIRPLLKDLGKWGNDGIIIENVYDPPGGKRKGKKATTYIVDEPTQIKSIYNTEFSPTDPDIRYQQTAKRFYSQVVKTVETKMPAKMQASDVMNWLRKQPGIKTAELEWMNVEAMLEGKKTLGRDELVGLLKKNEVVVEEVVKGVEERTDFAQQQLEGEKENYREFLFKLPTIPEVSFFEWVKTEPKGIYPTDTSVRKLPESMFKILMDRFDKKQPFKSNHWPDDPGTFAHVRINGRTDTNGDKVLFIEEIQSDQAIALRNNEKVPDFPFKKNWQEVVLKRIVRMAAEQGIDKIAWITGQQTADRYDLSKHLSEVHYSGSNLVGYGHNGKEVIKQTGIMPEDLHKYIGKELAEKLMEKEAEKGLRSLIGLDLKVGGDWAFNLYDRMIPQYLKKFGKKYGSTIGTVDINKTGREPKRRYIGDIYTIEDVKKALEVSKSYGANITVSPITGAKQTSPVSRFTVVQSLMTMANDMDSGTSFENAIVRQGQIIAELFNGTVEKIPEFAKQQSFTITPELKRAAMFEGMPLFQMAGKKAIGADKGALAKAQKMLAEGKNKKEVWKETGWLKGAEKEDTWKFEIDDSVAKIKAKYNHEYKYYEDVSTLDDLIDHPELFKAYPQLRNIDISQQHTFGVKTGEQGSYSRAIPKEDIPERITLFADTKSPIGTLLHEVSHAIQEIEGFAKGGSPGSFIRKVQAEKQALEKQVSKINEKMKKASGTPSYDLLMDERAVLVSAVQALDGVHGIGVQEKGYALYKSLMGEIEARDSSARAKLTAKQRREQLPYESQGIPEDQWIIRDGDGTSFSVEAKKEKAIGADKGALAKAQRWKEKDIPFSAKIIASEEKWYHGTITDGLQYGEATIGNQLPFGAHFTLNEDIAYDFATGATKVRPTEKGRVLEVKILAKNPLDIRMGIYCEGTEQFKILKEIAEKSEVTDSPIVIKHEGENVIDPNALFWKRGQQANIPVIKEVLKKHGFDAALIYSMKSTLDPMGAGFPSYNPAIAVLDKKLLDIVGEKAFPEKQFQLKGGYKDLLAQHAKRERTTQAHGFKETLEPISDQDYSDNRETSRNIKTTIATNARRVRSEIAETADQYLGSISTRLGNVSAKLKTKLRKLDLDTTTKYSEYVKAVEPLLRKAKKMDKNDIADWDYARKNSDTNKINSLISRYGMGKEYQAYREALDKLREEALDVGLAIGEIEEYAPRILKDSKGFLTAIGKDDEWPFFSRKIKERADELGIDVESMHPDVRADIISNMILTGQTGLGGIPATKQRKLLKIPARLNKYYMDSDAALMQHIHGMTKLIEARKFFGKIPQKVAEMRKRLLSAQAKVREFNNLLKDEKDNAVIAGIKKKLNKQIGLEKAYTAYLTKYALQRDYRENIGAYVDDLRIKKEIAPRDERRVSEILNARFHEHGARGLFQAYKNFSYIDTMGSPISALTQVGDLAWAMYEGGVIRTLKYAYKSATKQSRITKEDVGLSRIAQEFADSSTLGDAVTKVFKLVGLEKIDSIGKESFLNTAFDKYQERAKKEPLKLKRELRSIFELETDSVIEDLQNDEITENVKFLVYNRLLDFQPVALSEMPQKYLEAGNGRLFYMLKTFTLKVFDAFRNESYNKIKNGDRSEKIQGLKNLARLSMFFVLANAGADELKDFFLRRNTDLEDRVVDNILRLFGVSKFVTWKARTEGVGSALARQILPPFKFIDSAGKDIIHAGDEKGLEVIGSIPVVGKLLFWHIGRGTSKREDLWDKRLRKQKAKLNKIKDGLDKSKDKLSYKREHREGLRKLRAVNRFQGILNRYRKKINRIKSMKETKEGKLQIQRLAKKRTELIKAFLKKD